MKFRKRYIFLPLAGMILLALGLFIYGVMWIMDYNKLQKAMGDALPESFYQELPLIRDANGYFGVEVKVNGHQADTFLLDTKAASLAKMEELKRYDAKFWKRKPIPTRNFYGQIYRLRVYRIGNIEIGGCKLEGPLFNEVPKKNAMYNILYRPVIGYNILPSLTWKFSMDDNKMVIFSNKNQETLAKETEGYIRVKDGIGMAGLTLTNDVMGEASFMVDLGTNGGVIIDKAAFDKLSGKYTPVKYLTMRRLDRIDTLYQFNNITMNCNNIRIEDCSPVYIPAIDRNIVGGKFMGRMNFVLGYSKKENGFFTEDLYIRPRCDTAMAVTDRIADLGFDLNKRSGAFYVTILELGGKAEKAGLRIRDEVLAIDNGAVSVDDLTVGSGRVEEYIKRKKEITVNIKRKGASLNIHIQ